MKSNNNEKITKTITKTLLGRFSAEIERNSRQKVSQKPLADLDDLLG